MTADPKALAARLRERVAAVGEVVSAINNGTTRWRMSVPVQDDDPDMVIGSLMSAASAAADALDATPASATNERGLDGWWPKTDLRRAFLDGAKWWEYVSRHGTMWQSDQNRAAAEAERRYPNGVYDPTPAPASLDAPPVSATVQEARGHAIDLYHDVCTSQIEAERRIDALIAAVRADCITRECYQAYKRAMVGHLRDLGPEPDISDEERYEERGVAVVHLRRLDERVEDELRALARFVLGEPPR